MPYHNLQLGQSDQLLNCISRKRLRFLAMFIEEIGLGKILLLELCLENIEKEGHKPEAKII